MAVLLVLSIAGIFYRALYIPHSDAKMFYRDNAALAAHPLKPAMAVLLVLSATDFFHDAPSLTHFDNKWVVQ